MSAERALLHRAARDARRTAPRPRPCVLCTAGAMMCDGASPASWTMYSPRSVSTGRMPAALKRLVEPRLLGEHRLRLDHLGDAVAPGDVDHMRADFVAVARPQDLGAGGAGARLEDLQPDIEVVDDAAADGFAGGAQSGEIEPIVGQAGDALGALADEQRLRAFASAFCRPLFADLAAGTARKNIACECVAAFTSAPVRPALRPDAARACADRRGGAGGPRC